MCLFSCGFVAFYKRKDQIFPLYAQNGIFICASRWRLFTIWELNGSFIIVEENIQTEVKTLNHNPV